MTEHEMGEAYANKVGAERYAIACMAANLTDAERRRLLSDLPRPARECVERVLGEAGAPLAVPPATGTPGRDTPNLAHSEGRLGDAHELLLERYAEKPVRDLYQVDGHRVGVGDDVMRGDEDGHCLMGSYDLGLYNLAGTPDLPVRVLLHRGADKQEVLILLGKITGWLERDFDDLVSGYGMPDAPEDLPF